MAQKNGQNILEIVSLLESANMLFDEILDLYNYSETVLSIFPNKKTIMKI